MTVFTLKYIHCRAFAQALPSVCNALPHFFAQETETLPLRTSVIFLSSPHFSDPRQACPIIYVLALCTQLHHCMVVSCFRVSPSQLSLQNGIAVTYLCSLPLATEWVTHAC